MERKTIRSDLSAVPFTDRELTGWEGMIRDFYREYSRKESNPNSRTSALTGVANRIHSELRNRRQYLIAVESASRFIPNSSRHWGWSILLDTPALRIGLISLHRSHPIPLHDHPGTHGVLKVISGSLRVQQYQLLPGSGHHHSIVSLQRISDSVLKKSECSTFSPSCQDIHALEADGCRCLLLDILLNPYKPEERSWYYPISLAEDGGEQLFSRIRTPTAVKQGVSAATG